MVLYCPECGYTDLDRILVEQPCECDDRKQRR